MILLLNPKNTKDIERKEITPRLPPLNLLYLKSFLELSGITAGIWDENVQGDYLGKSPTLLGIGLYSKEGVDNLQNIIDTFDCPVVVGGPAANANLSKQYPDIAVVSGSGHFYLLNLSKRFKPGYFHGGKDLLEFPIHFSDYVYEFGCMMTQYGCPYKCKFCLVQKLSSWRTRPLVNVYYELDQLIDAPTKYLEFFDNDLFINRHRLDVLGYINGRKPWGCVTSIRGIDRRIDEFKEAADCGLVCCGFGVESLSIKTLKAINKQVNEKDLDVFLESRPHFSNTVRPYVFLMYGLPFQSAQDFWDGYTIVKKAGYHSKISRLQLVPGTPLIEDFPEYQLDEHFTVKSTPWMSEEEMNEIDLIAEQDRLITDKYLYTSL